MIAKQAGRRGAAPHALRARAGARNALLAALVVTATLGASATAAAAGATHRVAAQKSLPAKPTHVLSSSARNRAGRAGRGVHAHTASTSYPPLVWLHTLNYNSTWVGGTLTLDAHTSYDIGPTPYYTELFDATSGTYLGACGTGTDCEATVSQSVATTHEFIAYETLSVDTGFPPSSAQSYSRPTWITWSDSGWQTALLEGSNGYVAYANSDVGPTPYYIEVYDFAYDQSGNITGSSLVATCGTGTVCPVPALYSSSNQHYVAFVGYYSTSMEPDGIQANSEAQGSLIP